MNIADFLSKENEKPLDHIVQNGGFCGIFRRIVCIGDSLASGEFESFMDGEKGFHDYYDYSWGQFLARDAGCTVYNFSRGGMSAKEYCLSFADSKGYWSVDYNPQAYIIALGVNDVYHIMEGKLELGDVGDIDLSDYHNNKGTFAGYYSQIIQRYKQIQPQAKFFLLTMPRGTHSEAQKELYDKHAELLHQLADCFDNCYVLDFRRYAPEYDQKFKDKFYLGGHLNAAGYRLTALLVESYIDYIIRNNISDFKQIGFVGTPFFNEME